MSNWFTRIFSSQNPPNDGLTQAQREALLDLFNFCMCVDGKERPSEEHFIESLSACYHWDSLATVPSYTQASLARAREAQQHPEAHLAYAADINNRLATTELRADSVFLAQRLFWADGEFIESEKRAFVKIKQAFGWPADLQLAS